MSYLPTCVYLCPTYLYVRTFVLSTYLCVPMSYLPTCAFPTHGSATGQDFLSGISAPFRPHSLLLCLMGHCKWISIWICLAGSLAASEFQFLLPGCCIIQSEPLVKFHLIWNWFNLWCCDVYMNPFITSLSQPDPDMLIARLINPGYRNSPHLISLSR